MCTALQNSTLCLEWLKVKVRHVSFVSLQSDAFHSLSLLRFHVATALPSIAPCLSLHMGLPLKAVKVRPVPGASQDRGMEKYGYTPGPVAPPNPHLELGLCIPGPLTS